MSQTAQPPDVPADDFDVDLGRYARTVLRLWWLVIALAVVGALAGFAVAKLGTKTYSSTSAVYLGQPTDANGNAIAGLSTNPRAAQQIVQGEDVSRLAAYLVLNPGATVSATVPSADKALNKLARQIRNNTSVATPTVTVKGTSAPTNFVAITVKNRSGTKAAAAANALALVLSDRLGTYTKAKTELLNGEIADLQRQLATTDARLAQAQKQLTTAARAGGTTGALAGGPYMTIVQAASTERQTLQSSLQADKLSLLVASEVEAPRIISLAVAPGTVNARPVKLSLGAGLLAGIVIALVIAAFVTGRRPAAPAPQPAA